MRLYPSDCYHGLMVWEPRTYRQSVDAPGLMASSVVIRETDLQVLALRDLSDEGFRAAEALRAELDPYVAAHPKFAESYAPVPIEGDAPEIVQAMARAGEAAGCGPMAAVAGAIAERVARALEPLSAEVIVENGGDIYLMGTSARRVLLVAGDSPLSGKVALALDSEAFPLAVCTSSGKVGHSVSLGSAHAATVLAQDGALADAVATVLGNRVHGEGDLEAALAWACGVPGVRGAVVIAGDAIGARGEVRLEPVG
ncbi:MAG: UPF0280 family protein [Coriobacteriia bacterium]